MVHVLVMGVLNSTSFFSSKLLAISPNSPLVFHVGLKLKLFICLS